MIGMSFSAPKGGEGPRPSGLMELRPRTRIARRLRRNATEAEKRLWWALRELPSEHRFRRQHPIGRRVADFACPSRKLVIELDGGQHVTESGSDKVRTAELARYGYRVIRFWNNDVLSNTEGVIAAILCELEGKST
jgi:very-short-patch-repair endonuclease